MSNLQLKYNPPVVSLTGNPVKFGLQSSVLQGICPTQLVFALTPGSSYYRRPFYIHWGGNTFYFTHNPVDGGINYTDSNLLDVLRLRLGSSFAVYKCTAPFINRKYLYYFHLPTHPL